MSEQCPGILYRFDWTNWIVEQKTDLQHETTVLKARADPCSRRK